MQCDVNKNDNENSNNQDIVNNGNGADYELNNENLHEVEQSVNIVNNDNDGSINKPSQLINDALIRLFLEYERDLIELTDDINSEYEIVKNASINQREPLLKMKTHLKESKIIKLANGVIEELLDRTEQDLTSLDSLMYATVIVLQRKLGFKPK